MYAECEKCKFFENRVIYCSIKRKYLSDRYVSRSCRKYLYMLDREKHDKKED